MASPEWLDETEMRIWRSFLAASQSVLQSIDADLKADASLTLDDYEVLVHLSEEPARRLRMSELSERLLHSRSRLTQRIDRMERKGLVTREKCGDDARGTWAVLTDDGWRTIVDAAPGHLAEVRRVLIDRIPDADRVALADILARLATPPADG